MLVRLINDAKWFSNLGGFLSRGRYVGISDLSLVLDTGYGDREFSEFAWLPTSRDQLDPFYGTSLADKAENMGQTSQLRDFSLECYKRTLQSLRGLGDRPMLKSGPHDFTQAAKGGALFAARGAAAEIFFDTHSDWLDLFTIFSLGYWPCGILPGKKIVVL